MLWQAEAGDTLANFHLSICTGGLASRLDTALAGKLAD